MINLMVKKHLRCVFGVNACQTLILTLVMIIFSLSVYLIVFNAWNVLVLVIFFPAYQMIRSLYQGGNLVEILAKTARIMLLWSVLFFISYWQYHQGVFLDSVLGALVQRG